MIVAGRVWVWSANVADAVRTRSGAMTGLTLCELTCPPGCSW
ncbi:MAG: hypothetical protein ACTHJJ_14645 [Intrasporangium sp.]